jgi:hypothetical protein
MSASSSSGEKEAPPPDLKFPVLERGSGREVPAPPEAVLQILEISEAFLPFAAGRPEFEARRLAMKTKVPFRLLDTVREGDRAGS